MTSLRNGLLVLAVFGWTASAQTGFPFGDESLHYVVNWPSGLSLGDVNLAAHRASGGWDFEMTLDAGVPGFMVSDRYHSRTNAEGCSLQFERSTVHGTRKSHDTTSFDYAKGVAHRVTLNGGKSDLSISSCARDALAYVYFARRELGQGRVPQHQEIFFGAAHTVRLEYTGAQTIQVSDKPAVTDRVVVYIKGPASDTHFETFFDRDPARTPLSVRVPFPIGTLSMELAR